MPQHIENALLSLFMVGEAASRGVRHEKRNHKCRAIDSDYAIRWVFKNQYSPAHYFIDAEGRIRHHHSRGTPGAWTRLDQRSTKGAGMTTAEGTYRTEEH